MAGETIEDSPAASGPNGSSTWLTALLPGRRVPIAFGLRPRLLAALLLTAVVTLGSAAIALLTPLESQLRMNTLSLAVAYVQTAKTDLGYLPLRADGRPDLAKIRSAAYSLAFVDRATVVVWTAGLRRIADTSRDIDALLPSTLAERTFHAAPRAVLHQEINGFLDVAARYRAQGPPGRRGNVYVVELFKPVDYLDTANGVVRSAFLVAALIGLGVAILLGVALSSRLVRRLRRLQDASRSIDAERDLGALAPGKGQFVADEISELAGAFATMHQRLRQQEDARRAFVATASHELRTPLASLDGMLELLADDLAHDPIDLADARERVAAAQLQSRRLRGLASDLLDLSRIDAALELRSEPVELAETARAVAAEFDARARERDVALALDELGGQSWAQADPGSVARIVRILIDNALRFAPSGSMIEIRISSAGADTLIEVHDEGPGVAEDERELIFERFKRGRDGARSEEAGFGLGLAIGSELASRMGGSLELAAEEAAPGACFRLRLPEAAH